MYRDFKVYSVQKKLAEKNSKITDDSNNDKNKLKKKKTVNFKSKSELNLISYTINRSEINSYGNENFWYDHEQFCQMETEAFNECSEFMKSIRNDLSNVQTDKTDKINTKLIQEKKDQILNNKVTFKESLIFMNELLNKDVIANTKANSKTNVVIPNDANFPINILSDCMNNLCHIPTSKTHSNLLLLANVLFPNDVDEPIIDCSKNKQNCFGSEIDMFAYDTDCLFGHK